MKITDYEKVTSLVNNNVFLLDGDAGTKGILAHELAISLLALMSPKEQVANMVMTDLEQATKFSGTDRIMVGTSVGVKAMALNSALFEILDATAPLELRKNIFRGKNLGTALTVDQKTNIANGSFKGFFLGDYWEIGGRIWRIVDFDYWMNCGDTATTAHHLVMMPDHQLYTANMNDSNVTTGGYVGSKMYTTNLANAKTLVNSAFGAGNVLNHRELLVNAVSNGQPSGGGWMDSTVELANGPMMYGSYIITPANNGVTIPYRYTIDKSQLALMRIHPLYINPHREWFWLRDVVSTAHFARVNGAGHATDAGASDVGGVRPVFGIVG